MRPQPAPTPPIDEALSILIVGDHVSARYGGEAILPLHYFRVLRQRGIRVWLVTHARTRDELTRLFPGDTRISFVEDSLLDKLMWRLGAALPARLAYATTSFVSRVAVQAALRRRVRRLVAEHGIAIVHQPVPVSPLEPSVMFGVGAPVVIGPMNGGMDYPPAFRRHGGLEDTLVKLGRRGADLLNAVLPGKHHAALLLVANARTRHAMPRGLAAPVAELVENGVDLDLWTRAPVPRNTPASLGPTRFVFVGRLIDLKAVDLLLEALAMACRQAPMTLVIVGDGAERERLQRQARQLFPGDTADPSTAKVRFTGWLTQSECADELASVDGLVMPSLRDCGGAVVLEAMAMSLPVIATAWGGPLDYLDDSCGILVPPLDRASLVDGLSRAMVRLARAPDERSAMGRAGRAKVEACYCWEAKTARMLAFYARALAAADPVAVTS